ncbi:UNVERIFIED_CONTAM: hypothetical protein K2H54_044268 [Gekko kuhli]
MYLSSHYLGSSVLKNLPSTYYLRFFQLEIESGTLCIQRSCTFTKLQTPHLTMVTLSLHYTGLLKILTAKFYFSAMWSFQTYWKAKLLWGEKRKQLCSGTVSLWCDASKLNSCPTWSF